MSQVLVKSLFTLGKVNRVVGPISKEGVQDRESLFVVIKLTTEADKEDTKENLQRML